MMIVNINFNLFCFIGRKANVEIMEDNMLENKLGITDSLVLAQEEERTSKIKAKKLFDEDLLKDLPAGKFSTLQFIYQYLFEDIYDFAGKI